MVPFLSVKQDCEGAIAPNENVLAALAESSVEMALGAPFVDGLCANADQRRELARRQDDGNLGRGAVFEGAFDLSCGQLDVSGVHSENPFAIDEIGAPVPRLHCSFSGRIVRRANGGDWELT